MSYQEYNRYQEYSTDYDDNKYINLGLSIKSQELVTHLYHSFDENDSYREKFEDILYSVLEDIQKYKNENERLELAHKNEKENNDEIMTNMIEEAERQLTLTSQRITDEMSNNFERKIELLNIQHNSEISALQEIVNRMKLIEKKHQAKKLEEDSKKAELKRQIELLSNEKRNLISSQRELTTQASILRSEVALLKATYEEKETHRFKTNSLKINDESCELKQEITILNETNKKLNDTNDVLLNEITTLKHSKSVRSSSTPNNVTLKNTKFFGNKPNYMSSDRVTDDESFDLTDGETDSGNWTINSVLSDTESNRNTLSKELNSQRKSATLDSIVELSTKPAKSAMPEKMFKLCFFGDSAVGKTSFIIRYVMGEFYQSTSATLGVDFHIKVIEHAGKNIALQLWDTCGQERFRSIAISYFRKADGAVLMYDCTNEKSFLNVREWIQSVNYMSDKSVPIILIANKIDLRDEFRALGKRVVEYDEGLKLAMDFGSLFYECSTKNGTQINESLVDLCDIMTANQEKEIVESNNIKLGEKNKHIKKRCC